MAERTFVRLGLRSGESVLLVPDREADWLPEAELLAGERARTVAARLASELLGREVDEDEPLLWKSSSGFSSRSRGRFGTVLFAMEVDPAEVAVAADAEWERVNPEPERQRPTGPVSSGFGWFTEPPMNFEVLDSADRRQDFLVGDTYFVIAADDLDPAELDLISRNQTIRSLLGPPPDVRIFCDYCATLPFWGLDNPEACGLDRELLADLIAWQRRWHGQPEPEFCDESGQLLPRHLQWWQEQREPLSERVRRALGPGPVVTWR